MREAEGAGLERNLALFEWHQPVSLTLFWGPIFFLFLSERFPVEQVLQLGAIYYVSVVVLEVPSGYFSDRIGRVATLRISAGAQVLAYGIWATGTDLFGVYVAAQMILAFGYAFRSGTDASFHFDTLAGLGREAEFAERQARISRNAYGAVAMSALVGGGAGLVDLRLPYLLSAIALFLALLLCLGMREPPRGEHGYARDGFLRQLVGCARFATQPTLAWLLAYMTLGVIIAHIPWEFAQPYLAAVFDEPITDVTRTPLATGAINAMIGVVAAFAAAHCATLRRRLGLGGALLGVSALQTGLIVAMAAVVHPVVAALIALRSCQSAVADVLVPAAVAPRVPQAQRATYLSLHSFSGRLAYAAVLFGLSFLGERGAVADAETIAIMLRWSAALCAAGLLALALTVRALGDDA